MKKRNRKRREKPAAAPTAEQASPASRESSLAPPSPADRPTPPRGGRLTNRQRTRRLTFLGLATAVALVFAYVESLLPPLVAAVPGIKLGLPNIVIIFLLYRFGLKEAAAVSFVRIAAVALLFGNPMTFAYSVAGGLLSIAVMALLKRTDHLSTVGVSVAGGVFHNVGQILMAMLLLGTAELGYYLIVLAVTGTVSGIFIGLCGHFAVARIPVKKL